eukprot:NODE_1636_length_786_cov_87.934750_g1587_i0.p1 GENE.NODE_1636_length_786_cov_87.934750_g1587_i0~~NODE_1636_length_786_cov_87.934750_g1587_i0.p1  ORF type:complete len:213 (-),score=29.01 NODE_1636_length_786_cov_87.934750_g1587_i0:90-728(-)
MPPPRGGRRGSRTADGEDELRVAECRIEALDLQLRVQLAKAEKARLENEIRLKQSTSEEMAALACCIENLPSRALPTQPRRSAEGHFWIIVDRDNRGQKYIDDCREIPPNCTVFVCYNPASKHPFANKPRGDLREYKNSVNEDNGSSNLVAYVAGVVCEEGDPERDVVFFVYETSHDRHSEPRKIMEEFGFQVELEPSTSTLGNLVRDILSN